MHAGFTTTGHKKAKKKFASAEQKRQHEQLEQEWADLVRKHATKPVAKVGLARKYSLAIPAGRGTGHIPSKNSGVGVAAKADVPVYTGTGVLGIAVQHKSCLQPIFTEEQAKESATMRRG
jgi:hypothetical protein